MKRWLTVWCALLSVTAAPAVTRAVADWPQFQQNAAREGRAPSGPAGPYRARWIWCGRDAVLRNKASSAKWSDDLTGREGYSFPLPASVEMTFAEGMQPIHAGGVVYVLDEEGRSYAIDARDSSTKWVGVNPGGSINTPVLAGRLLISASLTGRITAAHVEDGKEAWSLETRRAVTGSPALVGTRLYVANHAGDVYAIDAATGQVTWRVRLGGPCVGGIAADESGCYLGAQDRCVYALNAADGGVRAKTKIASQGFRMLWPVLWNDAVLVQVVGVVCAGSEHVFDDVLQSGQTPAEETRNVRRWLAGDDNAGEWKWASTDMKHFYVLDKRSLKERYVVPNGPSEGCGYPADPPAIDTHNRPLLWFRTKFPTFTSKSASFGTRYTLDVSTFDPATGDRVPIDNGHFTGQGAETDNAFAFSVGGDTLFMRQRFRGTHAMDLAKSRHYLVQVESRRRDGGAWDAPVSYVASGNVRVKTPHPAAAAARTAPSVAEDAIFFAEPYCITCVESAAGE